MEHRAIELDFKLRIGKGRDPKGLCNIWSFDMKASFFVELPRKPCTKSRDSLSNPDGIPIFSTMGALKKALLRNK